MARWECGRVLCDQQAKPNKLADRKPDKEQRWKKHKERETEKDGELVNDGWTPRRDVKELTSFILNKLHMCTKRRWAFKIEPLLAYTLIVEYITSITTWN